MAARARIVAFHEDIHPRINIEEYMTRPVNDQGTQTAAIPSEQPPAYEDEGETFDSTLDINEISIYQREGDPNTFVVFHEQFQVNNREMSMERIRKLFKPIERMPALNARETALPPYNNDPQSSNMQQLLQLQPVTTIGIDNDQQRENELWAPRRWPQYLAVLMASLSCLSIGYIDGWTAFAVPFFKSQPAGPGCTACMHNLSLALTKDGFPVEEAISADYALGATPLRGLTDQQASWLCSLVAIGGIMGSIPAGYMTDILGRRGTLLLMTFPCIASWGLMYFGSDSLVGIYLSRLMAGFMTGVVSVVMPLYAEEIGDAEIRGSLIVFQDMMLTLGLMTAYVCTYYLSFPWTTVLACIFPMAMLACLPAMPETPMYLVIKRRWEEAKEAISYLRGPWTNMDNHLLSLHNKVELMKAQLQIQPVSMFRKLREILSLAPRYKGVRIVFFLMFVRQLTGINAVGFYTVEIFSHSNSTMSGQLCAIIIGLVEVVANIVSSLTVDCIGRRPLLLLSALGMTLSHLCLTFYYKLTEEHLAGEGSWWVPVLLLSIFIIMYSIGFGPLPWLLMTELIRPEDKRWATGVAGVLNWIGLFFILQIFSTLTGVMGTHFGFLFFCACCMISGIFALAYVPETKGKSLQEIQQILLGTNIPETSW